VVDVIPYTETRRRVEMVSVKKIGFVVILGVFCVLVSGCTKHYAVLISTNEVKKDDIAYHSEWWYDLFLQYKMLRELGYKDDKIYVLYGEGTDFGTVHSGYNAANVYGHTITDSPNHKSNIQSVFNSLSTRIDGDDFLYVWWMGHGSGSGTGMCNLSMLISNTGEYVTDVEFASYLNLITSYGVRSVNIMTCHSGGMIDNLNVPGNKTVTFTSSTCVQSSYDGPSCDYVHADFNYDEPTAHREEDPCGSPVASDSDGNGSVELDEAFDYITANVTTSTPQQADPDGRAPNTTIKK
jgi:hypothetical protein